MTIRSARSVLAMLIVALASAAPAADWYVAATGSDANPGTQAQPFRQIRKALTLVHAGDNVLVGDGQYLGFNVSGLNGASGSPISIRASGAGAQVMPTTDRSDNRDTIFVTFSSWIVIDGFRSFNANRSAMRIDSSPRITVRNCVFGDNTTWGILTDHSDDLLIESNECYGSKQQHGIYVGDSGKRPVVRGNRFHDNAACGLHMNGGLPDGDDGIISGALVERNIVWSNGAPSGGSCINCDGVQDSVIRDNLIYNAHASGISLYLIDGGGPASGNVVVGNTVDMASDGRWALNIGNAPNTVAFDNILLNHNSAHGSIHIGDAATLSSLRSDYNVLMPGSIVVTPDDDSTYLSFAQWQARGYDTHSRGALHDALFVNWSAGDYRLRTGAVAIDAGVTAFAGISAPTFDLVGAARPQGAGYDIGAYEVPAATANQPPTVAITGPASGASFTAPATVTISANAADSDGTIAKVDFYQGATLIGSDTSSPYSVSWSNVAAGTYTLTAQATDNAGAVTTSSAVAITVTTGGGAGTGLLGQYWTNQAGTFTGAPTLARTDATVNFDWGNGSPASSISSDRFSARWTGQVQALFSQTYTFFVTVDDGARLWVNDQLLIDRWSDHSPTEFSGSIALVAGQQVDLKLEYYENGGGAVAKLAWSSASTPKATVPTSQLYPASGSGLQGQYWTNQTGTFTGAPTLTRTDATIDFDWGSGSPAASISADHFTVRWTGYIRPPSTGTWTFTTVSDDGVRLWVNGQAVIADWTDHPPTTDTGAIALTGGTLYPITMEYYENAGGAVARLLWSSGGSATPVPGGIAATESLLATAETIPIDALYPASTPAADGDGGGDRRCGLGTGIALLAGIALGGLRRSPRRAPTG